MDRRFINENQHNLSLLLRLMILQEENYRLILSNVNNTTQTPTRNPIRNDFTFLIPTLTNLTQSPINRNTVLNLNEIDQTTITCLYETIDNPINTECAISRDVFTPSDEVIMINHCRHIFKPASLRLWLSIHSVCPICRHNLRDDLTEQNTTVIRNFNSDSYETFINNIQTTLNNIANESTVIPPIRIPPIGIPPPPPPPPPHL